VRQAPIGIGPKLNMTLERNFDMCRKIGYLFLIMAIISVQPGLSEDGKNFDIYFDALSRTLMECHKILGSSNEKKYIVELGDYYKEDMPNQIGDLQITYLARFEMQDRYKKNKKKFMFFKVHPMRSQKDKLSIDVDLYGFRMKKGLDLLEISDYFSVYYRFDCEKKTLVFDHIELTGI
jgi:hypothetical protein